MDSPVEDRYPPGSESGTVAGRRRLRRPDAPAPAAALPTLRDGDLEEVRRRACSTDGDDADRRRARILLLAAEGRSNAAIAASLKVSLPTVLRWRRRYAAHGLRGLSDEQRSGRPRQVDRELIVATTAQPRGGVGWTCRTLAAELGVGVATVSRCWRDVGMVPLPTGALRFRTRPVLQGRAFVVLAHWEEGPASAVVLAVDPRGPLTPAARRHTSPAWLLRATVREYAGEPLHVVADPFAAVALRRSAALRTWWATHPRSRCTRRPTDCPGPCCTRRGTQPGTISPVKHPAFHKKRQHSSRHPSPFTDGHLAKILRPWLSS